MALEVHRLLARELNHIILPRWYIASQASAYRLHARRLLPVKQCTHLATYKFAITRAPGPEG